MNKTFIRKGMLKEQANDFAYWQSRPYYERILALNKDFKEFLKLLNEHDTAIGNI